MPVYNNTTKKASKSSGFVPGSSTAFVLPIKKRKGKGIKTEKVMAHTDQMHWLGYKLFLIAGQFGVDLTRHVTPKGRPKKELRIALQSLFKKTTKKDANHVVSAQKFLNSQGY